MAIKDNLYMDPWSSITLITNAHSNLSGVPLAFEDNFGDQNHSEKLPDSLEYLAKLTTQLEKITLNPNLLKELAEKRESCMQQLLLSSNNSNEETADFGELDEAIGDSSVLRTIAPEKQALTKGELVELIKYDQLKITVEEEQTVTVEEQ